jgi:hypothetical protein
MPCTAASFWSSKFSGWVFCLFSAPSGQPSYEVGEGSAVVDPEGLFFVRRHVHLHLTEMTSLP